VQAGHVGRGAVAAAHIPHVAVVGLLEEGGAERQVVGLEVAGQPAQTQQVVGVGGRVAVVRGVAGTEEQRWVIE